MSGEINVIYIPCMSCNRHYILKEDKYGYYAGCSNFPRCRAYLTIDNWVLAYIHKYGIGIYRWERECWKCGNKTPIYSYYLNYELGKLSEYFDTFESVGLGDIYYLDRLLEQRYSTIHVKYSRAAKAAYIANACKFCNSIQGKNYVVDDPHEIFEDLWVNCDMSKYYFETVWFRNIQPLREDIKRIYGV